jgi:hypothetical protein
MELFEKEPKDINETFQTSWKSEKFQIYPTIPIRYPRLFCYSPFYVF